MYHELDLVIRICPFQLVILHDSVRWRRLHRIIIVGRDLEVIVLGDGGGGGACGGGRIIFRAVIP